MLYNKPDLLLFLFLYDPVGPLLTLLYQPLLLLHIRYLPLRLLPHLLTLSSLPVSLLTHTLILRLQGLKGVKKAIVFLDLVYQLVF